MTTEAKQQHWQKEFEIGGVKLRVRKLSPFEFPAFKTAFAKATEENDAEGIGKAYETMSTWLEYEFMGEWVKAYDKKQGQFVVANLNDAIIANKLIDYMLVEIITPLFLNTAE